MYVLFPNTVNGLAALESQLTTAKLNNAIASMHKQKVKVSIPKFNMTWGLVMDDILKSIGITDMYKLYIADLSGIDGTRNLYVSGVIHKAFVDVNEEGTEATAATAVVIFEPISVKTDPPVIFKADHPFLFFIREKITGSILSSGRVVTPPKAQGGAAGTGSGSKLSWCKNLTDWLCKLFK